LKGLAIYTLGLWAGGIAACMSACIDTPQISGYVSAEGRYFFQDPLFAGQQWNNGSMAAQPGYYPQWANGSSLTFVPFARLELACYF
jgi:hypothetical protein